MYSYTAATLAIRAKCALSHCYLSLPDDQPHCCHLPCCHFPVSPRMLSGYLLGMSSPIPSRTLIVAGRRRLRVFCRSRDPEMMGLLAEPEERFPSSLSEVKIKSVEGESRGSRKDGKAANCSLRRSDGLSSVASSSSTLSPARRRARRESLVGYGNIKKGNNYDAVIVVEEEAREVQKHVNDSWREWRYSSKSDDILDSRKDEPLKTYGSFTSLAVEGVAKKIDRSVNSAQQVNSRENGSDRRSQKATRVSDVQSDDLKRTSVSANVKKIEKGLSLASAARQSSVIDHQGAGHSELRRGKQSKMADLNVQSAAYPRRDFEETSIRGREEQDYMEQNSAQVTRDKRIHLDQRAVEQDESRRNTQRLSQVSVYHGSDFESSSRIDDKRVMRTDLSTVLVQDSGQVPRNERFQSDLQMSVENKSKEREEKLTKAGNSIQLRGERKWIDRGTVVQDEARRNAKILSQVSQIHSGNAEPFSLYRGEMVKGMEFRSDFVQSSIPSTKDKGTQVEMNKAYHDQIEVSRFNADNIVDATSSRSPPESRVDSQEYSALLASNQVSSRRDQPNQAGMQAHRQSVERVESERDANEFDLTRVNTRRISSLQETYHSRIENLKETSSAETSSVVLAQQRKERQRSSITGESSQSASMQMDSTGSLHGISSSQPTYNEQHHHGSKVDIQQIQNDTVGSSRKLDKSSGLHAGKFVDKPQKEIVALKESGKAPIVSVGIQMREPGKRDFQATLGTYNQKETSLTVVTQERKEIDSSLFLQSKTMQMASTGSFDGVSSTVKTHSEVDNDSDRDDILKSTNYAIESAERLDKSSAFHVDEFVDEIQQEMMSLNKSGKEPNVSTGFQIEETGRRESQSTSGMQVGELTQNRRYEDGRYIKEGGRLSSSGSGMRGPSDETWDVQGISSQETTHAEEPEENSPSSGAMGLTTPTTMETAITRSPKSLWSYVADIIRMSWILRGHSHSSTLKSDKRTSSNESLSSEAWFSGPEPDEDGAGDETQNMEKIGLLKESAPVKESVELSFEESKNGDRLTVTEPHSPISSGFMTSGLSARTASSSVEAEHTDDSKSSQGILSSVPIAEQKLASKADAAPPSISDIVESRIRDKVKVLKPSSSYPVGVMRTGFSSSITEATGVEQMEAAQVREGNYSSLEIFEQPLVSTADSALPKITDIDEVDMPGNSIPKLELDPFIEKQPEVGGIKEAELKRRKVQRNNQVRRVQFDEWEEAFKRENDQKKLDEYFMREAILEAKKGADIWEVPVGAVLVQNGKIIARGCNRVEELRDSTAHAEMICIREASNLLRTWRLAETTLYVTLEPCPMCAGAILQARVDTVVWGAPNRLLGADGSWVRLFPGGDGGSSSMNPPSQMVGPVHPFHPNITIRRGVLETECGDVMQQFFKLRRKKDKKPESSPASCLPISNRPTKFFTKLHNLFCMMFCL